MSVPREDEELAPGGRALAALREVQPPAALEDAVVAGLRARGLIRSGRRRRLALALLGAAALAVVALVATALAGRRAPPASTPRFMLLLYEGKQFVGPQAGREASYVGEYVAWARAVRGRGIAIEGEKLKEGERVLGRREDVACAEGGSLAGWFVIAASDYQQAVEVARTCPHLAHGGTIAVRAVDGT